jgi:hypothetical protein
VIHAAWSRTSARCTRRQHVGSTVTPYPETPNATSNIYTIKCEIISESHEGLGQLCVILWWRVMPTRRPRTIIHRWIQAKSMSHVVDLASFLKQVRVAPSVRKAQKWLALRS